MISSQSQQTEFSAAMYFDYEFKPPVPCRYPQKYDTIDRRRKKKPSYNYIEDSKRKQYVDRYGTKTSSKSTIDTENDNFCHTEKKHYPVLLPHHNGFRVKSDMRTNPLERHDYVRPGYLSYCEKSSGTNCHATDFIAVDCLEDSTGSSSDELLASSTSDKPEDLLSPTWHPSSVHHIGDVSEKYCVANSALPLERINSDAHTVGDVPECSVKEMTPSCIGDPKEDYIDTMDELQCLVETVSEYLAEKEEEINRFGSLSKAKNTPKQNNTVDNVEQNMPGGHVPSSAVDMNNKDNKDKSVSFPELGGVKSTVGSLFTSLTEKVSSGTKHLTTSVEKLVHSVPEKTGALNQIETVNSECRPSDRSVLEQDLFGQFSLSPQIVDDKDISKCGKTSNSEGNKSGDLFFQDTTETLGRASTPQNPSSVIKSVFTLLNPLKIFSEKEEPKKADPSKSLERESLVGCGLESNEREETLHSHSSSSIVAVNRNDGETTDCSEMPTSKDLLHVQEASEPADLTSYTGQKGDTENLYEGKLCVDLSLLPDQPEMCPKKTSGQLWATGSRTANQQAFSQPSEENRVAGDHDFLEPLRKSFSQFLFTSPETCSKETLTESVKNHQPKEDGQEKSTKKNDQSFSFSGKLHIPFFRVPSHSEKQQDSKEKGSVFPLFKFPFTDRHNTDKDQSFHGSAAITGKKLQTNCHEDAKYTSAKSNSVPDIHNDLGNLGSTDKFNQNDQINCPVGTKFSSIKSSSVPNIYNDLGKIDSTKEFNNSGQINCPKDPKFNMSNSAPNINNLGELGNIEELNPGDHLVMENYERDTLTIPEVVPKEHIAPNPLEVNNLIQVTSSTVSSSSLESISTVSKSTLVDEMSEVEVIDKTSQKRTQGGLLSGLFNRFSSSENLSSQQELNLKKDDSYPKNNTPSLFISGIFNFISNSGRSDCKPDETKLVSLDETKSLNGNKHLSLDEAPATSCVTAKNQRNYDEKQETSDLIKKFSVLPKESTASSEAWIDDRYCPLMWKSQQDEKKCSSSENIRPLYVPVVEQGISEKSMAMSPAPSHVFEAEVHENSKNLNLPIINTNILNKLDNSQSFEGMNNPLCFEWDANVREFSKNSRKLQPVCYMVNHNAFPSTDAFLWPDSENSVTNFCQKDKNANILEWRTNPNGVIWCDLPYESSNQLAFNEDYLLRGDMWAASSLYGNSDHIPINESKNSLNELPIDLSCTSDYDKVTYPTVDQQLLRMDEYFVLSSFDYEYQEWLSCLENGIWWPSEDGNYGHYMFHDGQYIYSVLTDPTGQYAYLFIPDYPYQEYLSCDLQTNDLSDVTLDDSNFSACRFNVFDKKDEILYVEEEALDDPLDLSISLRRSEESLYLNLETFSQVLEKSSYDQRDQPLDFSGYNPQKFKENFRSFKERPCGSENLEYALDFRNQSKIMSNHVSKRDQITEKDKNQSPFEDSSVHFPSFHQLQSSCKEASPLVHPEIMNKGFQQAEKTSLVNKVTPAFSVLGALVKNTLTFGKDESVDSLIIQDMNPQSVLTQLRNDDCQSLILSKPLEDKSQKEEASPRKDSERQIISSIQRDELTEKKRQESPLSKSSHVKEQNLPKSDVLFSDTIPQVKSEDEVITVDSVGLLAPPFKRNVHKDYELSQDQSTKEPEKTLFKSALKLFGRGEESSVSAIANEKQASGFLSLFKTHVNKEGSSDLEKDAAKKGQMLSQDKKETSSVSNFFGTLGDLFKTSVSPSQTTDSRSDSSVTSRDDIKSTSNSVLLANQDVGNIAATPVSSKRKARGRGLSKQTTIDESGLKETSTVEIPGSNLIEKEIAFRNHLIQQPANPSLSTGNLREFSRESSIEASAVTTGTEVSRSNKTEDTLNKRNSNEQGHFLDKDCGFSTATTFPSKSELPTRKSMFSFLTRSEKSEKGASNTLPRARSQAEGLFILPSLFSSNSTSIKKDVSSSSSTFSFFGLSFLDEKQQAPEEKPNLMTAAPVVTSQPHKKPAVVVDWSSSMASESSRGHRDSPVQEVVLHEQQMAPCVSNSSTVEDISLADELSVEETQEKLAFCNEPETFSDFQVPQLQQDGVPPSPEFQAKTGTFCTDPETLGVAFHEKESFSFPRDFLATSSSYDNQLIENLNDLDSHTSHHRNEQFTCDPLNLPLEKASEEVLLQSQKAASSSSDPGDAGPLRCQDADKEEDRSVLGSPVEMLSGFVTKVKSFSECLIEPPKSFSGLFTSPKSPKKNPLFSVSPNTTSLPPKGEFFGLFKSPKSGTCRQESPVATSRLQHGYSRDAVGPLPPEHLWREVASEASHSESTFSDCRMAVFCAMSNSDNLTDDYKLTTKMEDNNVAENMPETQGPETVTTSSVSEEDPGQGALSLSDEGDMGMLQGTDTEASLEAEHILLPTQLPPDPISVPKGSPPSIELSVPPEPEPAFQTTPINQDVLELQATKTPETSTTLSGEASVRQDTALEIQEHACHPLPGEPVLCAKESCGILHAQKDPPAVLQETEPPKSQFEIPKMNNWPKLSFSSSVADHGKPLSSFFSRSSASGGRTAETGLMSSFKKLSALFEGGSEGKGSMLTSDSKLGFGRKQDLSFQWPKENKEASAQMPAETTPPVLLSSSDQDLHTREAEKTLGSSQISGDSAEPVRVHTQASGTAEQLEARPNVYANGVSGPEEMEKPQEVPATGEHLDTEDSFTGSTCPSRKNEKEHCTVSELLHQPGKQEEEAVPACADSVSGAHQPATLNGIKEPMTDKRLVFSSCIINGFKELTIYDASDLVVD